MFQQTLAGTVLEIIKGFVPSSFVRTVFQQTLAGTVLDIMKEFVPTRFVGTMFHLSSGGTLWNSYYSCSIRVLLEQYSSIYLLEMKIMIVNVRSSFVRTVFQQTLAGTVLEIIEESFQTWFVRTMFHQVLLEQCSNRLLLEQ